MLGTRTSISTCLVYPCFSRPHKPQGLGGCILKAGRTPEGPRPASHSPQCACVMNTHMLGTRTCDGHAHTMSTRAMDLHR